MRIGLLIAALVTFVCAATPASAGPGKYVNVIDDGVKPAHGAVQLVTFRVGRASDKPDDFVCAAYIGNTAVFRDQKRAVALADQAFEEFIGDECASAGFRSRVDGKVYGVGRCFVYVGDEILILPDQRAFEQGLLEGSASDAELIRVEYRMKDNVGRTDLEPHAVEFARVSQPESPVGPSLREPNMAAVPTVIEPAVTIGLENKFDHTYHGNRKPSFIIFYQTSIPYADKPTQRALAQKVVRAFGAERLKRGELKGVSIGAFNEPKRSRFHFRLSYRYDTDENGDMAFENAPTAGQSR